ncbi:MAG: EAL domain-containing protein [Acidimicrobiales bacterium]
MCDSIYCCRIETSLRSSEGPAATLLATQAANASGISRHRNGRTISQIIFGTLCDAREEGYERERTSGASQSFTLARWASLMTVAPSPPKEDYRLLADADVRFIAESIPHIVFMAGADGSTEYFNRQGTDYTGLPPEANYGWSWVSLLHPDDAEGARVAWEAAALAGTPFQYEFRIRRFDGEYRWHSVLGRPIRDAKGAVVKWIGTATDIDDATRSAADLRISDLKTAEALRLLETILSNAPFGFAFVDRDFRIVRLNEALAAATGLTVAECLGQTVKSVVPGLWAQHESLYHHVLDSGEALLDLEIASPDLAVPAQTRQWLASYYPVSLEDEIIGIGVVVVDVTARKAGDDARQLLSAIVGGSADAIFGATTGGTVTSWNAAAERLFGYEASEIIGQPVVLLAPPGRVDEQVQMRARLSAGGPPERLETVRQRKDGSTVEVLITASTALDDLGRVVGLSVIARDITEAQEAQRALEVSQRRLADAQRIAHIGSFEFNVSKGEQTWSEEQYRILGLDPGMEPGDELYMSRVHPEDATALEKIWKAATERGIGFDTAYRVVRPDGEERCVRARAVAEVAEDGSVLKLAGTLLDDTEWVAAERVRQMAETRFEIAFEQATIGSVITDSRGVATKVNPALCALLGRPADVLVGRSWVEFTHPDEVPLVAAVMARVAAGHDTYEDERRYLRPDGSVVWASCHVTLVRDEAGKRPYFFSQLQDITARKQVEGELAHQVLHDTLTGLPNRALLNDRLLHGLAGSRRRGNQFCVMFLDLDNFKVVNDSFGHTAGDELLRNVAERIARAIRPGDTVARFGGDEFVIVCDDISALESEQISERVLEAVGQPHLIRGQQMTVTASLGIAVAGEDATPDRLLRDSDTAMYRAKERGRGRIEIFDEALRLKAERRVATASALRHALERGEFVIHYQPIVDLSTGLMVSAEALLRWEHPTRGLVGPDEFIPLAEEAGIIVPIGAWVLEQACQQLVEWQRLESSMSLAVPLSMAVNLSVRQVTDPAISELVEDVLKRTGVRPADLCLELTENLLMEDVEYFEKTLASLKSLGVRLAIDDFGTGYSSLSYLKRFPVDAVKVDRAFVDGLGTDPHDSALVAAIVSMADALDLEVTAEGVETEEQLADLKRLHCRRAQGFYLGRPMTADAIKKLVAESHRWEVG